MEEVFDHRGTSDEHDQSVNYIDQRFDAIDCYDVQQFYHRMTGEAVFYLTKKNVSMEKSSTQKQTSTWLI